MEIYLIQLCNFIVNLSQLFFINIIKPHKNDLPRDILLKIIISHRTSFSQINAIIENPNKIDIKTNKLKMFPSTLTALKLFESSPLSCFVSRA